MQLLFTNKISHHNHLCHHFGGVNIQVLSFSKENGAMKIIFAESTPWIMLVNFKVFKLHFCSKRQYECRRWMSSLHYTHRTDWSCHRTSMYLTSKFLLCLRLSWSKPFKLETSFKFVIFLSYWKSKLRVKEVTKLI